MKAKTIQIKLKILITCLFLSFPLYTKASDFIQLTIDPAATDDVDKITLLLNRKNITHVEIMTTKTPERAWYQINIFTTHIWENEKNKTFQFKLECNDTKIVNAISKAIRQGVKKPVNAVELCRKITS